MGLTLKGASILAVCLFVVSCTKSKEPIPRIDLSEVPRNIIRGVEGSEVLDAYFTKPGTAVGEGEDPLLDDALVALIDAATTRIDLCLYEFEFQSIEESLMRALDRGVTIRMVGDGDESWESGYQMLQSRGVTLSLRKPRDRIMHNKYVVVDEQVVWTGSTNISHNGILRNNNNGLLIQDSELASQFLKDFEQMFDEQKFGRKKISANSTNTIQFRERNIDFFFAPEHNPIETLAQMIQVSTDSVFFMIFSFTHQDVVDAMVNAHQRGVHVVGIMDESQARGRYSKDEELAKNGIPIYIDGNKNATGFAGGKLHHKVMVIDGGTSHGKVITGSFNWSKNATRYNDENLIVLREPALLSLFNNEFCELLEDASLHPNYAGPAQDPCQSAVKKVFLNEILPDPVGSDSGQEFVEIVNGSTTTIDLSGWSVGDSFSPERHVFEHFLLEAGEAVVIYDGSAPELTSKTLSASSGSLSLGNQEDKVVLVDATGVRVDELDYFEVTLGVSFNRKADGNRTSSWTLHNRISLSSSSPGLRSDGSAFVASNSESEIPVSLIINEVFPNPSGTDTGNEFVEVVNVGYLPADLVGWKLGDLANPARHTFGPMTLEPGKAVVVFDSGDHSNIANAVNASSGNLSLNNHADTISIYDPSGKLHDQVAYGSSLEGVSLNRAIDAVAGVALVNHSTVQEGALSSSPGTRVDGSLFEETCFPNCDGISCGDDGCSGSCGSCAEGSVCENGLCALVCVPTCGSALCGDDGCGGVCGICGLGFSCLQGVCSPTCTPQCSVSECGSDGCGGHCGICSPSSKCVVGGCVSLCTPSCAGNECGNDGCGGICGSCGGGLLCLLGSCIDECKPNCLFRQCGVDGCGNSCGTCDSGSDCLGGVCTVGGTP